MGLDRVDPFEINFSFNMQRFLPGEGYHKFHNERASFDTRDRCGVWMIYLNDAKSGTEFPCQEIILEPKQGLCAVWPAYYTHPHKGVTPNRGDKYIVTGWINFLNPNDENIK